MKVKRYGVFIVILPFGLVFMAGGSDAGHGETAAVVAVGPGFCGAGQQQQSANDDNREHDH
jgi:hypothetical protein